MHYKVILRILGILLMIFSFSMLPPLAISYIYADGAEFAFIAGFFITLITGFIIWIPVYRVRQDLRTRDGFLITVLFWAVLGFFGAFPFMITEDPHLSFVDAVFESMSGLTTTGATVITGIDYLPKSILFYRQQLQWLGGMGIIVLAVAILPMLGIGGMQLYRAEIPGPVKDSKLTPRITETAKALWYIYLSLTIVCGVGYWLAGMDVFDAVSHSFSTVAIGGFSTHDASIGHFDSVTIELICVFFMIVSTANFGLHFFAWRQRSISHYLKDPEFKFYLSTLVGITIIALIALIVTNTYEPAESLRKALFMVVSIATTTGFATADFAHWPVMLPFLLFVATFAGGCAGSTGGGMKVIRVLLILKQGYREIQRLVHPNAIIPVKLGKKPVSDRVLEAVWGFFSVYMIVFVVMLLALLATGLDQVTAWSAVGATLNNLGPGLGGVSTHYGDLNQPAKWVLCFAMLLGRLEVFTLLVLFTPIFWKR
ncbi:MULTISPECIES: TrkH family potassium uptake protein [unclassified Neptuniibacter]|jgi:trk system potassium uptake protein TrkH|uniref:TrkH family potassium uptake protein n=1 Tax=unclassified Neptuniibacter TaxID=2630693 RepID=UPI0026E3E293|nr:MULTISPECIES: TrkH family potassium uptake protein [unclassified Neptuniibacter]MDO6514067.1 TrkH family potassium uptake protein [Neptuniibacter sp. 2_MG-2023]MDO6594096.1 TrkH family potassium uptake protein [Neptuniibacter sp. 1_MG-2023]